MKKLAGVVVTIMLGLFVSGCDSSLEQQEINITDTNFELEQNEAEAEKNEKELTKEEQQEVTNEEEVTDENKILTVENDEEFRRIMTSNLTDEEYKKYFDENETEMEFNGSIAAINLRDGYDTRAEMLLVYGNDINNFTGPYMKVKDIGLTKLKGFTDIGTNVKVKAKINSYNEDKGYLEITIENIEVNL